MKETELNFKILCQHYLGIYQRLGFWSPMVFMPGVDALRVATQALTCKYVHII